MSSGMFNLLRLSLTFTLLLTAGIVVTRLQPYDDSQLRAALMSSEDCALPCWQGIRPGVTTSQEALAILMNHDWIANVLVRGDLAAGYPGTIVWTWSGAQPMLLNNRTPGGRVLVINNVVEYIRFPTDIRFGDIWLAFDHPDTGRLVGPVNTATGNQSLHQAAYKTFVVESAVVCPVRLESLWQAPMYVELRDRASPILLVEYQLAQWMRHPPC